MSIGNKFAFKTLMGFSMGLLIGAAFVSFFPSTNILDNRVFLFIDLIGSGIFGAVSMGGSIVYDLENWGVTKATFVHYLITFMSFFVANELLNWFDYDVLFFVFIAMTVAYFIIWFIEYIIWKSQVSQMNRNLKSMMEIAGDK